MTLLDPNELAQTIIDQAHTIDEFIEISALEAGARFFSAFIGGLKRM